LAAVINVDAAAAAVAGDNVDDCVSLLLCAGAPDFCSVK